jgi:two-component system CheB/CheR fusion protein
VAPDEDGLDSLLEHIHRHRGIDFSSYKRSTLQRRVGRRMQSLGIQEHNAYVDYLQASPEEFVPLLDTLFINVTGFFRDPEAWAVVNAQVIPEIVQTASADEPARLWCAGVASGEEAFTLAMLLAEEMGVERVVTDTKIFATDLDEGALLRARNASYSDTELESVPDELRGRYFERAGNRHVFKSDLRRAVIFGRHNLLDDAPIARLRMLVCRNTLMYFNREAQSRVLARFHFALRPDGYLFLGKAEMLLTRPSLFQPVDGKARLFRKVADLSFQDRLAVMSQVGGEEIQEQVVGEAQLRDLAFDTAPVAELILDAAGKLALANGAARSLLRIGTADLGRPFYDLDASLRPAELRGPIETARQERRTMELGAVAWRTPDGDAKTLEIRVQPLQDEGALVAIKITLRDVTRFHEMSAEVTGSKRDIETAYEELQYANEELETTNAELQSTVEELETTNEELQSTNEELETTNAELQSTNVEIETVNTELSQRTAELESASRYTRSILDGLGLAVVVVDTDLNVQTWSKGAQTLWGLRAEDAESQSFVGLDIGLPVEELRDVLRQCVQGKLGRDERILAGHDRKGKPVNHHVTCVTLAGTDGKPAGAIVVVDRKGRSES